MPLLWTKLYRYQPERGVKMANNTKNNNNNINEEIAAQARFLGHRYLSRKMRRMALAMGTASLKNVKEFEHRLDEQTTLIFCQLIETLEQLYPETYGNISSHILLSSFNERQLCQDFAKFCEELFQNGIKSSLLLAFFAFGGGLAEECWYCGRDKTYGNRQKMF
eukprot:gene16220-17853_t